MSYDSPEKLQLSPLRQPAPTTDVPPASLTLTPEQPAQNFQKPEKSTVGEQAWHLMTYTGVGYLLNLGVSIAICDWFLHGKGKPLLARAQSGAKSMLKTGGMSDTSAQTISDMACKYATFPLGGHFTMIPVKIAEDHGRYIAHRANQMLDSNYAYKDLKADWNTPDNELPPLSSEPTKNTWGQVAMRRGIGWAAVIGAGTASGKLGVDTWLENKTLKFADTARTGLGFSKPVPNGTYERWMKIGALDAYFTALTSFITEATKQTFGKERNEEAPLSQNTHPESAAPAGFANRLPPRNKISPDAMPRFENYAERALATPKDAFTITP